MALAAPVLNPKVQVLTKKNNRNKWDKIVKSYVSDYLLNAQNAGGFSATAVSNGATAGQNIAEIMKKPRKVGAVVPIKIAKEIATTLMSSFQSVNQTVIVTAAGMTALQKDLNDMMKDPTKSKTKMPQKLVKALDTYAKSCTVSGIIPGSPPIPFTGPLV